VEIFKNRALRFKLNISAAVFFCLFIGLSMACRVNQTRQVGNHDQIFPDFSSNKEKFQFDNLFIEGCKEKITGNPEAALMYFMQCYRINPKESAPLYEMAMIYFKKNDLVKARQFIEKALDLEPLHYWYNMLYAEILYHMRLPEKSAKILEHLHKYYPEDIEVIKKLIFVYDMTGNYEKSLEIINQLEKLQGFNEEIYIYKKNILLQQNKINELAQEARRLINLYPSEPSYWAELANIFIANEIKDSAQYYINLIKEKFPDNPQVWLFLADYEQSMGSLQKMLEYLEKAIQSPDLELDDKMKIIINLYDYLPLHKDSPAKKKLFEIIDTLQGLYPEEAKVYTLKGDYYLKYDKKPEALLEFLKAKNYDPGKFAIWNEIVLLELELEMYDSLIVHAGQALEYFPERGLFYFAKAVGLMQKKQYSEAESYFLQALTFAGNQKDLTYQIYLNLAEVNYRMNKADKAFEYFDKAKKINPADPVLLNNYAYYLSERNLRLDEARQMIEQALKIMPDNPSFLDTYGWVLYKQNNIAEALKWLEKAAEKSPANGTILEHLGDAYYKNGQTGKALEYWMKAKNNGNDNEILNKKITEKKLIE
jgi:tetratricopeptide (TPR) repeat protein